MARLSPFAVLLILVAHADAQSRLFTFSGAESISGADRPEGRDVDFDGIPDLLVTVNGGSVELRSGADGSLLRVLTPQLSGNSTFFGGGSALIDVNGDGVGEVVLGEPGFPGGGRVSCWDVNNVLVQQWSAGPNESDFGHRIVPAGDVDGDGGGDVFVEYCQGVSSSFTPIPQFRVFRTGGPSWITWSNFPGGGVIPLELVSAGDIDGDGNDETAVGFFGNIARIVEPSTAATIHQITTSYSQSIEKLISLGDIDADGVPDLAISGRANFNPFGGPNGPADVVVHSGATGALILTISNNSVYDFGSALVALGDVDGDGIPDLAIGGSDGNSPFATAPVRGECHVYSGATGSVIASFLGPVGDQVYGSRAVSVGDLDGNGTNELMILNPGADTVEVWSIPTVTVTASAVPFGSGCGAATPPLLTGSPPIIGTMATLTVTAAPAPLYDLLIGGSPGRPTLVGAGPTFSHPCAIYFDIATTINYGPIGAGTAAMTTISYAVPNQPNLAGYPFVLQEAVYPVSGGVVITNGLMLTLGF